MSITSLGLVLFNIGCNDRKEHLHGTGQAVIALDEVLLPANNYVISQQKTVSPKLSEGIKTYAGQGYITYDPRRNKTVASRVAGRVEKLYVKYNNQYVKRGQRILDLYSPDLNSYVNEYLFLRKNGSDRALVSAARDKLQQLGMTSQQIHKLDQAGTHTNIVSVFSNTEGYINFQLGATVKPTGKGDKTVLNEMAGMGGAGEEAGPQPGASSLSEGAYVSAGQSLFAVNDLQEVWAVVSLPASTAPHFRLRDKIRLQSELRPGEIDEEIDFIEPVYDAGQRFMQIRVHLKNPGRRLKLNSLIIGKVIPSNHRIWVLPASSVYDLGRRKIVWALKGKTATGAKLFEAREVVTGVLQDNTIQVLKGLDEKDQVAQYAGYMVDSEGFILMDDLKQ
ncbi:MAG TPA: efflux RND transporter periplasmic adaptor subunit [Daejeonella sp.]